jgi:hypothetical protein
VEKHGLYVAEKYSWTLELLYDVDKSNLWKLITKIFLSTLRGQKKTFRSQVHCSRSARIIESRPMP